MASLSKEESSCFESGIIDSFRCSLCLNVLRNPVQCQRNEHHFCKACIARHLKQSLLCPSCKEDLSMETLRPAPQILIKLLSQLKVRCDYNNRGCVEVMKVEELESHHKVCNFAPVVCSNKDCSEVVNRSDQATHETQGCQFRLVKCSVCGEHVVSRWYKMHLCVVRTELEELKSSVKKIEDSVSQILAIIKPIDNYVFQGIKQDIIVCGGKNCMSAEMYNWRERIWVSQKQQMKFTVEHGTSFSYKGELIVTGVIDPSSGTRSDYMEAITLGENFSESEWKAGLVRLPHKCYGHATVLVENRLLLFGGCQNSFIDGVYEIPLVSPYTPRLLCRMPEPRCYHGAGLFEGKVCIVGGQTNAGASNEVLLYDLKKNKWKKLAALGKAVTKMATVCWKDNIVLLGGQSQPDDSSPPDDSFPPPTNEVVMYNITTETSSTLPPMTQARSAFAAVSTGNTMVVMGGYQREHKPRYRKSGVQSEYNWPNISSVEYFNFELNDCWRELPSMKTARRGATAHIC